MFRRLLCPTEIPMKDRNQSTRDHLFLLQNDLKGHVIIKESSAHSKSSMISNENESNSKSLYPSLNEFHSSDASNDSSNESNDNSSVDSLKTKSLNACDSIAFADDSDIEDNNNISNNKHKIDSNYVQRLKQSIPNQSVPSKPPRAQSPANLVSKIESIVGEDDPNQNDIKVNTNINSKESNHLNQCSAVNQSHSRPPRPLPPSKPRIATSSENTYL